MPRSLAAAAVTLSVVWSGCSDGDDSQPPDGSDRAKAGVEATLDRVVGSSDLRTLCGVLSSQQLTESFGQERDPLKRCLEKVARSEYRFEAFEVQEARGRCARVEVLDRRGEKVLFFMREIDGRWLVNEIEDPSTPTLSSETVCGEVRLFPNEGPR